MKISLCMIVKNEEKNIVNCLDRALKVVDEAVIVDTGSTDKTKDLLIENYGRNPKVKIIEYKWESDFSKARNKSLEYATGDWILVLDADERIFCNRDRLEDFLESREDKAYIIPVYNVIERHNITITSTMIRLFKNDNPIYKGAIHEQILVDGKAFMADKIGGHICKIYHYGYAETVFEEKGKQDRNMDIIKAQIEEEPNSPFHWYNKGVMEMCQKNYDTAIDDFIKSHELTKKKRMAFHNDLVIRLLQCMLMEKKYKTAIKFVKTVANDPIIGQIPDIYYYWGIAHANIKNYPLAVKNFRKAIEKGEYEKGTSKYGAGSFLPKIEWAKVLLMEKKKEEAIAKYKEAVFDENNINRQGLEELKYLLKEENKIEELNQLEKDLSIPKSKENSLNTNQLNNSDFGKYKSEVKENIKILVENGMLKEAKEAIKEYEKIIEDDINIYSIKGVIAIMEGDMDGAERILIKGLDIQSFNCDLLYNLAYLYEAQEKYITAYRYYNKVSKVSTDEHVLGDVNIKIEELKKIGKVREYIDRKKVLFVAHIFPPVGGSGVQRSLKFVKYLRNFGWEPIVVTVGKTRYPLKDETMLSEIPSEIEIIRIDEATSIDTKYANQLIQLYNGVINDTELMEEYIKELNKSQNHLNQLILLPDPYILWATEVLDKIDDKVDFEEIDIIYSTSGPYSDHVIGYYLKRKYNKPWVADFRDEWTNNPYIEYDKNSTRYKMDFAMEKNIIDEAEQIITPTIMSKDNYLSIFNLNTCKVGVITNGYDEEDFAELIIEKIHNNKFTIVHNGLLYMIRTPETFLTAIENLIKNKKVDRSKISVIFPWIENEDSWSKYIEDKDLMDVVRITGYLTHEESLNLAAAADLLLLIIGKGDENKSVYTGKVFEYLRLCKPILSLSPKGSLVEKLIDETNRGKNVEFDDIDGIEGYVLKKYRDWENGVLNELTTTQQIVRFERKQLTKELNNVLLNSLNVYNEKCKNNTKDLMQQDRNAEIRDKLNREKIAFFVIPNGDSFLNDVINDLSKDFETKKIIVTQYQQIDQWMQWADICWFEWCDHLMVYASKLPIIWDKKIICRIHSYEVFTNYPKEVNWEAIDKIIFVAQHIRNFAMDNFNIAKAKAIVIANGVNLNNWKFRKKEKGFNIAYVGYIDYKKGPMLLLHTFKAIYDKDSRYKFYIAGKFLDNRDMLYFQQMIKEFGLEENFFFDGWQDNLDEWLDNKDYVLCTSILESQNMSVMQAMSKGIKPIIHNFVGAKQVYNGKYVWNTIDDAEEMILSSDYNSSEYRKFIEDNYSLDKKMSSIRELIDSMNYCSINKKKKVLNICTFYYDSIEVKFYLPFFNDYIQKVIYTSKNFYEIGMLEDIKKRLGENKIIIDAGANIGNHTVYFSKICKADKVYSFEPQENIYQILKKNIEINNMKDKVKLYNIGLGNEHFYANIDVVDENNLGMSKIDKDTKGTIEIDTLDNVLLTELNRVDMIKIDVEGMEIDVLEGAKEILRKFKPIIYIEAATDEKFKNITIYLQQYGYQAIGRFNATPTYLFI